MYRYAFESFYFVHRPGASVRLQIIKAPLPTGAAR